MKLLFLMHPLSKNKISEAYAKNSQVLMYENTLCCVVAHLIVRLFLIIIHTIVIYFFYFPGKVLWSFY